MPDNLKVAPRKFQPAAWQPTIPDKELELRQNIAYMQKLNEAARPDVTAEQNQNPRQHFLNPQTREVLENLNHSTGDSQYLSLINEISQLRSICGYMPNTDIFFSQWRDKALDLISREQEKAEGILRLCQNALPVIEIEAQS